MFLFLLACSTTEAPEKAPEKAKTFLAQQLYAGEQGAESRRHGDRTRILLWLQKLKADPSLLKRIRQASQAAKQGQAKLKLWEEEQDRREAELLVPLYDRLSEKLAQPQVDLEAIEALKLELVASKAHLEAPQAERLRRLRLLLDGSENLLASLEPEQRKTMVHALFFLRQPVSPQLSPVYYHALVGVAWPPDSFASLRRLEPGPESADPLDIAGLWTYDEGATVATEAVEGLQRTVLMTLALLHPELEPSIEVFQGTRRSDDFGIAP